jgi:hypothetical protein
MDSTKHFCTLDTPLSFYSCMCFLRSLWRFVTVWSCCVCRCLAVKYVWQLKRRGIEFHIKWLTLKRAKPYSPASNRCNLCLWETYFILCKPELATLNKRNELVSSCRCFNEILLKQYYTTLGGKNFADMRKNLFYLTFKGHALETDTFLF